MPPFFTVKVPEFDVAMVVQRVWVSGPSKHGAQCGASIVANPPAALERWRALVDSASPGPATGAARA